MPDYNQAMSADYLENQDEDQILFLYSQLMKLPFSKKETIFEIEKALYQEIAADPQDILGTIALMQVQTMIGDHEKAKSYAYKLWNIGAEMINAEKYIYINNLLDIGLLNMASELLRPLFENLSENIQKYYPVMLKFSTMTGSVGLVDRLINHPLAPYNDSDYNRIISRYKNYNYSTHFKNVSKIIMETLSENLCVYDFYVNASVMEELEIGLYVNERESALQELAEKLKQKIQAYYAQANIEKLSSFSWRLFPVETHSALGLD